MSDSISIFPFENVQGTIRFGIQIAIFLVGLYVAHKLIVKPSLRLHAERKKRTARPPHLFLNSLSVSIVKEGPFLFISHNEIEKSGNPFKAALRSLALSNSGNNSSLGLSGVWRDGTKNTLLSFNSDSASRASFRAAWPCVRHP